MDWKKIYETEVNNRAEIVKAVLTDRGIHAVVLNKKDSSLNNFGSFEVHVPVDNVIEALKIINDDINFE